MAVVCRVFERLARPRSPTVGRVDSYIKIKRPDGRGYTIHGSEREIGGTLVQISRSFETRGGFWLRLDEDSVDWVPAASCLDIVDGELEDGFPIVEPQTIETF